MKCGLLGRKLGHSYSPAIHSHLGNYSYELFEKEPEELEMFLKTGFFDGINVTMPYKKSVIPFLDELTPAANVLGAVNTIVRREGRLIGHNTDLFGFTSMLEQSGLEVEGKKCLVCGSGGASNTVCAVLKERGAQVVILSRSGGTTYEDLLKHTDAAVVVNCTPVGMYPHTGQRPLDLASLPHLEGVLDVVYNPARTQLLLDAEALGLVHMNGLWMLVAQAAEASEWFQNRAIDRNLIRTIYGILKVSMENIILIGMPGCGKSTLGRLLAQRTGKAFVDSDEKIVEAAGMTIPEIFRLHGEEHFRRLEHQVLQNLGKESGLIIATGGGCVTRPENYAALHQNGTIYWIQRSLDLLPTDGRPLSQSNRLEDLYNARKGLYARFADGIVHNDGEAGAAVAAILEKERFL
ncbi:MAG: shikimate kinase [Ruminococcaceae bacterium]|nr:shikimate kinase [Oscillospiraceae bacterium]